MIAGGLYAGKSVAAYDHLRMSLHGVSSKKHSSGFSNFSCRNMSLRPNMFHPLLSGWSPEGMVACSLQWLLAPSALGIKLCVVDLQI